jgi:CPA1 family monovalent cation:H+ antiporter
MLPEAEARARVARAQLGAVERRSADGDGGHRHPRLVEQYGYRARAAARYSETGGALAGDRAEHFGVVLAATAAGRAELLRLHRTGTVHDDVLHALEQELDLEEMSARRLAGERAAGKS